MRHTTIAAAVLLLTLTACTTDADSPPAAASSKASQSAATQQTSAPPAAPPTDDASKAALERAVHAYSHAYLKPDAKTAHSMMTNRCQATAPIELYTVVVEGAAKRYGSRDIKTLTVDRLAGDRARVSYTYAVPGLDQREQPWAREDGVWRYDGC
jgi:hypothetical protein